MNGHEKAKRETAERHSNPEHFTSNTHCFFSWKRKSTTSVTNRKKKKQRLSNLADACVREKTMKQKTPIERTTKLKFSGKSGLFYPSSPLSCKAGHTERFYLRREMLIYLKILSLTLDQKK